MKKDLEWLRQEVVSRKKALLEVMKSVGDNAYVDGSYTALLEVVRLIDQVEQPTPPNSTGLELPVVPRYVGEHAQKCMLENLSLFNAMEASYEYSDQTARLLFDGTQESNAVNQRKFAVAYLFGYTIEEKRYKVEDAYGRTLLYKVNEGQSRSGQVVSSLKVGEVATDLLSKEEIEGYDKNYMVFAEASDVERSAVQVDF